MKNKAEEPVVTCNGCNEPIKNTPLCWLVIEGDEKKYYSCKSNCKTKIIEKVRMQ